MGAPPGRLGWGRVRLGTGRRPKVRTEVPACNWYGAPSGRLCRGTSDRTDTVRRPDRRAI